MKRKSFWISTGLLIVPVVIFYMLSTGVQNYRKLPVLGPKIPPAEKDQDTVFYAVPDFYGWDQASKKVTRQGLSQSIYIASFFYPSCRQDCLTRNRRLAQVYEKYAEFTEVQLVSFAMDSTHSSVDLATYAAQFKAKPEIWHFVHSATTPSGKLLNDFLVEEKLPAVPFTKGTHPSEIILVDKQSRVRGIYDSESEADILQLQDDLKVLLYEYHQPGL